MIKKRYMDGHDICSNTVRTRCCYELTSLDAQEQVELPRRMVRRKRSSDQSPVQVAGKSSNSEGAATAVDDVMRLEIDPIIQEEVLPKAPSSRRGSVRFCSLNRYYIRGCLASRSSPRETL